MKTVQESLLKRTSVRRYQRMEVTSEQLEFIYKAIQNTPTSYNGQQFSVIAVSDQQVKLKLYEITGEKQIKTCAIFLVFCVDFHKLKVGALAKKINFPLFQNTIDGYTVGVVDAALALENAVVAAESLGLGSCCVGHVRTADPQAVTQLLGLPQGVSVVCGLSIGVPSETPDLKPKMPLPLLIHENHYRSDEMTPEILAYDKTVTEYNRNRTGTTSANDWVKHILDYYIVGCEYNLERYLKEQGLDLKM